MTARKAPPPPPDIPFQGLVKLAKPGWDGVPDSPNPFYFGAKDGLFLHRRSLLGRGVYRVETWPSAYPEFGNRVGGFKFEADPIPAQLMGQIVNFFERIYDRQHTEAAVLLVMHSQTREWRVFVPTQLLSHGGVNYVFDPTHIKPPWLLVGSIHSHCDFGAGHSGIDTNDADGFDGLHCTIGHIKRDVPEIVAMISGNKRLMHYKPDQFPFLFDFSEAKQHTAPAWWDRYCEDTVNKVKPEGYDLFAKFQKSTKIKAESTPTIITKVSPPAQPNKPQWHGPRHAMRHGWPEFPPLGKGQHGLQHIPNIGVARPLGADPDDWTEFYRLQGLDGPPAEYAQWSPQTLLENGYTWDPDARTWKWTSGITRESAQFNAQREADDEVLLTYQGEVYWEDALPKDFLDILFDSELVYDEDVEFAVSNPDIAGTPEHWRGVLVKKAFNAVHALRAMGMDISLDYPRANAPADLELVLLPETTAQPPTMQKGMN